MDQILDIVASKFEERDISIDVILPNIKPPKIRPDKKWLKECLPRL